MKFLVKFSFANEAGNEALKDPQFGSKMKQLLTDIKAESAYFTTVNGQRGAYVIVNMDDASQMPAIAEPLFLWLQADIECMPVMLPQDLEKGGPAIAAAVKKWG